MTDSVYTMIVLVGTSHESWEKAAAAAIEQASHTLRDLRIARIIEQDIHIEPGQPLTYRVKVELSFRKRSGPTARSEPPTQWAWSLRLPQIRLSEIRLPHIPLPHIPLPQIPLPQIRLPQIRLPKIRLP